jgi:hypothetical protein
VLTTFQQFMSLLPLLAGLQLTTEHFRGTFTLAHTHAYLGAQVHPFLNSEPPF